MSSVALWGCSPDPVPGLDIVVTAHQLEDCPLPDEPGLIELKALGDFDASVKTSDLVTTDSKDARLAFPPDTLALSANASFDRDSRRFSAYGEYRHEAELPLLLWPTGRECALVEPNPEYPAPRGGQGIGYSSELSLVMLAGSNASESAAVAGALTFHTGTGEAKIVPPGDAQLLEPRAFATVTAFGPGFLVAGGEDPTVTFPSGRRRLRDTAEVYVASEGRFDANRIIMLRQPRTHHAALALTADLTLLVGGRTASDAGEEQALQELELVDSQSGRSRLAGSLRTARIAPKLLELSDGSLFVAGGYDLAGKAVPGAEWLRRKTNSSFETAWSDEELLPRRVDQDFIAMPGGAVLAVGGCEDRSGPSEDCSMCRRGCQPEGGWDAFWISALDPEQGPGVVRLALEAATPRPRLIPAPDGAPLLVAPTELGTDGAPKGYRLMRFDPWAERFDTASELELPPDPDLPIAGLDVGAAVWVSEEAGAASLVGRRFSTRHAFAQDLELITLVSATNALWPLHLAPGRARQGDSGPNAELAPSSSGSSSKFSLHLSEGATVWITDARYADFALEVTLESGSLPELLVDDPGHRCAWRGKMPDEPQTLRAARSGTLVVLSQYAEDGNVIGEPEECEVALGRVALGLGVSKGKSELSRLNVRRGTP